MYRRIMILVLTVLLYSNVYSLFAISKAAQEAVEILKSTDTSARRQAAAKLASLRSRETVPALIDALKDEDAEVRTSAADALGNLRDKRAVDPLIKVLKDKNRSVRTSSIVALGFIRDKRAVKPVINVLKKDKDTGVKVSAAQVAGILGDTQAVKPLIAALTSKEERLRAQAARSLGRLPVDESAGPLIELIKNKKEKKRVKKYAIESLGEIKTAKSMNIMEKLLKSEDLELAVAAASSLGKQGNQKGLEVVLSGLISDDVKIRRDSIMGLSYIGKKNDKVEAAVRNAAKDSDSRVRSRAQFVARSLKIDLDKKKKE